MAPTAIAEATRRNADLAGIVHQVGSLPQWAVDRPYRYDLVCLVEVGYYFEADPLARIATFLADDVLTDEATVLWPAIGPGSAPITCCTASRSTTYSIARCETTATPSHSHANTTTGSSSTDGLRPGGRDTVVDGAVEQPRPSDGSGRRGSPAPRPARVQLGCVTGDSSSWGEQTSRSAA